MGIQLKQTMKLSPLIALVAETFAQEADSGAAAYEYSDYYAKYDYYYDALGNKKKQNKNKNNNNNYNNNNYQPSQPAYQPPAASWAPASSWGEPANGGGCKSSHSCLDQMTENFKWENDGPGTKKITGDQCRAGANSNAGVAFEDSVCTW